MWKSTPDQYGRVAIAIHWVSALLIVALLVSGFRADATADAVGKITVLRAHAAMGITILILTLARIAWWRMADRKPPAPEGTTNSQHRAAQLVHVLFYVVILGMAVSGIGMLVLSGAGAILFGGYLYGTSWTYPVVANGSLYIRHLDKMWANMTYGRNKVAPRLA